MLFVEDVCQFFSSVLKERAVGTVLSVASTRVESPNATHRNSCLIGHKREHL